MRGTSADAGPAGVTGAHAEAGDGVSPTETKAPGRTVLVGEGVVVKTQKAPASRRERIRTQAGSLVAEQTGLFVVPKIISFDDALGQIVFERLPVTALHEILGDRDQGLVMMQRVAEALAAIHGRMVMNETAPEGSVPLHGDFALTNVLHLPGADRLVVIDWANAEWIGDQADHGPAELDVAVFLTSLFHRRAFYPRQVASRHEVARHFLATYASLSPHGLDLAALRSIVTEITPAFIRLTRRLRGPLRALAYRHSMIDLDLFLRRAARAPTQL